VNRAIALYLTKYAPGIKYALIIIPFTALITVCLSFYFCSDALNRPDDTGNNFIFLNEWLVLGGSKIRHPAEFKNISEPGLKWIKASSPADIYKKCTGKVIWIRTKLPSWKGTHPSVYIGQVDYFMQVFLNDTMIYETGNENKDSFLGRNQNLVSMPDFNEGDELFIRIRTGLYSQLFNRKILLGPSVDIIRKMFSEDIFTLLLAVIFTATGFILLIFIPVLRQIPSLPGIAVYLVSLGIKIFSNSNIIQLVFNAPKLFYYLSFLSFLLSPIAVAYTIEQVAAVRYKKTVNISWKIMFLIFAAGIIIVSTTNINFLDLMEEYALIVLVSVLLYSVVLFKSLNENKYEIKILIIGLAVFFLFILIQVSLYILYDFSSDLKSNTTFTYIGAVMLMVSMAWIAVDKYLKATKQKETIRQLELEAVKHENEVRRYFAAKLMESQENERNRIALELHDSVGQKLLLIKNHLVNKIRNSEPDGSGKSLTAVSSLAGELIHEIRNIIYNLRPQHLDQLGLTTAIETMLEKVSESSDINFHINIDNIDDLLSKGDEISFYRIVQECLNNIVKHSQASDAYINIKKETDSMLLEISDNGTGFNTDNNTGKIGIGLTGIRERARLLGSELNISSSPGSGTVISLEYKVNKKSE